MNRAKLSWLVCRFALVIVVLLAGLATQRQLPVVVACVAVVVTLDFRNLVALRNFFLLYCFLLFIVGGSHFFPDESGQLAWDMLFLVIAFVGAYAAMRVVTRSRPERWSSPQECVVIGHRRLIRVIIALTAAKLAIVGHNIIIYGPSSYLSGQLLVDRIGNYGKYDPGAGIEVILINVGNMTLIAAVTLYVTQSLRDGGRLNWPVLAAAMIGPAAAALQRAEVAFAVLYLFVIWRMTHQSIRLAQGAAVGAVAAALLLGSSVGFGTLRQQALPGSANGGLDPSELVYGELSPVVMYRNVRMHSAATDLQLGRTMVPPFVEKWIPRNFVPDKPDSSGAYLARLYDPAAFQRGFALAPTVFADFILNFGWLGALLGCSILGLATARLDLAYIGNRRSRLLPLVIITYYYAYAVLRNDLANSLSTLVLSGVAYVGLTRVQWLRMRTAELDSPHGLRLGMSTDNESVAG